MRVRDAESEMRDLAVARPARLTLERSRAEVEQLLDAAWAVLGRNDFDGLKVQAVLNEAGLSTQVFYRHFRSKSELLVALAEQSLRVLERQLDAEAEEAPTGLDAVRSWVSAIVTIPFDDRTGPCSKFLRDRWPALASSFPDAAERWQRQLLDPLERSICRGCRAGEFGVSDPVEAALVIHELCTGVLYTAPVWARRGTSDETVAFVMRAAEALLRVRSADAPSRVSSEGA
jgi:AcrR family transcriptional regulator